MRQQQQTTLDDLEIARQVREEERGRPEWWIRLAIEARIDRRETIRRDQRLAKVDQRQGVLL